MTMLQLRKNANCTSTLQNGLQTTSINLNASREDREKIKIENLRTNASVHGNEAARKKYHYE